MENPKIFLYFDIASYWGHCMEIKDKLRGFEPFLFRRDTSPKISKEDRLSEFIPGEEMRTPSGACYLAHTEFPGNHIHGSVELCSVFGIHPEVYGWTSKDPRFSTVDLNHLVFIDTETTGLAGGTGTVPFLVGMGWFEGNVFRIEQFFMRDYHEERPLLSAVKDRLANASALVSFNGKAFDLYLLRTRFILSRMPFEITLPHLDLLFTARRIWKYRLNECTLCRLEQEILGFSRETDVPSTLIPSLYFDYLRSRNAQIIAPIFQHNVLDILSLVSLTSFCGQAYAFPKQCLTHPLDLIGIGQSFLALSRYREAVECFQKALSLELPKDIRKAVLIRLGFALKHLGEWENMLRVWEHVIQEAPDCYLAYEEIAKYHEHRSRNIPKAIEVVEQALSQLERGPSSWTQNVMRNQFLYRMERLKRKLSPRQWESIDLFHQEYER